MNISCETTLSDRRQPSAIHTVNSTAKHTINRDMEKSFAGCFLVCHVSLTILLHEKNNYLSSSFLNLAEWP